MPEAGRFGFGYVREPVRGHEQYDGFLAIPYLRRNLRGAWSACSIRFRCLQDHDHTGHGKYMTVRDDPPWLYNTAALQSDSTTVAITEGELDAVTAELCGIRAVGVPGSTVWKRHWRSLFVGFNEVLILADGDDAGTQFGNRVSADLPNARVVSMPPGQDVNSLFVQWGKQALLEGIS